MVDCSKVKPNADSSEMPQIISHFGGTYRPVMKPADRHQPMIVTMPARAKARPEVSES